ncbi:MAG TPA: malto-oligosyltrehalose trehalohydrolase [Bryobacteraceae bacterium]|nr:malto-oligosyltrehalose trehalohydrolase [Bryobacteraceae bacterium]
MWKPTLGANFVGRGTRFRVWAPDAESVEAVFEPPEAGSSVLALAKDAEGFFNANAVGVEPGTLYRYRIDGRGLFPDPASRFQPCGVHGPSQVVDTTHYTWTDADWRGIALPGAVLYELHVGTFTPEGTFRAAAQRLPDLKELGITAIELMPVADFAGDRNWGYDGVSLFAPARCYGTPEDLQRLVDEAHAVGLAIFLDVVYNHFGPDGAYHGQFSRDYFSDRHSSPWGAGINFDGPGNSAVRDFVIENALYWVNAYHIDGLRLDATDAIVDDSPRNIVASIADAVHESAAEAGRQAHVVAEDIRNLSRMLQPEHEGGWGLDAVWSDDFHHHVRRAVAGDTTGYYGDFDGAAESIARTAREGWYFQGQYSPHHRKHRGSDPSGIALERFVFYIQNHDQVGNRPFGDRLHHTIPLEAYRAVSTLLLLLAETPLLFMGQEWAAGSPFRYFTDHHADLGRRVTEGRHREFSHLAAFASSEERDRVPGPQDVQTFLDSGLRWEERHREPHTATLRLYRELLKLRRRVCGAAAVEALGQDSLAVRRDGPRNAWLAVVRLRGEGIIHLSGHPIARPGREPWRLLFMTEDPCFAPDGQPPAIQTEPLEIGFATPGAVLLETAL